MLRVKDRVQGSALNFKELKKKSGSLFVIFIKWSSFTPTTNKPQLQEKPNTPFLTWRAILIYSSIQNAAGKMHTLGGFIQSPVL